MKDKDLQYLKQAIDNSRESMSQGNFPAGAIVVKDNKVIASEVSSPFPNLLHADSKAITAAFNEHGLLEGATLYIGLESCMMCTGVAYWGGIRRIVFAVPKSQVSGNYYETPKSIRDLVATFNQPIELVHMSELEDEALAVVREWERNNSIQ